MTLRDRYRRALVTGGAGFIGSHLVDRLLDDGLEVVSLDDYSAGKALNLECARRSQNFTEVRADVTEVDTIRGAMEGVDVVFHQACSKNTICLKDPARDLAVNATGTLNMLMLAKEFGVKKFVHASTGSVYGEPSLFPTDESHPLAPVSYYGTSKLAGDRYAAVFHRLHGLDTTILRYHHVFGPRQDNSDVGGVVSIFARRALRNEPIIVYGDGHQVRSFTYVDDVVAANLFVATHAGTAGEAFNVASGIKVTINDLAHAVREHFDKPELPIEYRDWKLGDIVRFDVNHGKLTGLGFRFRWAFRDGLAVTMRHCAEYAATKEVR